MLDATVPCSLSVGSFCLSPFSPLPVLYCLLLHCCCCWVVGSVVVGPVTVSRVECNRQQYTVGLHTHKQHNTKENKNTHHTPHTRRGTRQGEAINTVRTRSPAGFVLSLSAVHVIQPPTDRPTSPHSLTSLPLTASPPVPSSCRPLLSSASLRSIFLLSPAPLRLPLSVRLLCLVSVCGLLSSPTICRSHSRSHMRVVGRSNYQRASNKHKTMTPNRHKHMSQAH